MRRAFRDTRQPLSVMGRWFQRAIPPN